MSLRLVASRGYLERRGMPGSVAELSEHETLGWNRPGHPGGEWPLLAGGTFAVAPWFSSSDPQLLATLATRDAGIFLAPSLPLFEESESAPLQAVLDNEVGTEIVFRATTPFPARAAPRTRDTLQLIIDFLEGLPQD